MKSSSSSSMISCKQKVWQNTPYVPPPISSSPYLPCWAFIVKGTKKESVWAAVTVFAVFPLGPHDRAWHYYCIIFIISLITFGCNIYEHENVVFGLLCVRTCPNATSEMCLGRVCYPQPSIEQFWWSKPVPNDTIMNTNQSHWFYLITNQHLNSLSSHVGAVLWGTGQWRWVWILVSVQERIKSDFGMVCMHIHGAKK